MNIVVDRSFAAGDLLQALPIATALEKMGHSVFVKCNSDLHFLVTRHRNNPLLSPLQEPFLLVDLNGAYENHPDRKLLTFAEMYVESANKQLQEAGIRIDPKQVLVPKLRREWSSMAGAFLAKFPRPWVMIVPRSHSPHTQLLPFSTVTPPAYNTQNRTVPDQTWCEASYAIKAACFWLGIHAPAPRNIISVELYNLHDVVRVIDYADAVATVDTGPMHIACALGIKTVAVKQSADPQKTGGPSACLKVIQPNLDCLACWQPLCPINTDKPPCQEINPLLIADAINEAIA